MQKQARLLSVMALLALGAVACGDETTETGDASSASSTTGGDTTSIHGCTAASAEDHTGDTTAVTIAFGGANGNKYVPACVRIKAGGTVAFKGSFATHPMEGGEATDEKEIPDTKSPLLAGASAGELAEFTLDAKGTYPFYCIPHGTVGMRGAIFVE